jgi:hypothetical protein
MLGHCYVWRSDYFCLPLHAVQLLHDVLLPALAPETADDSGQFRRSWSLGRDKTKKGKVMFTNIDACIPPSPQARIRIYINHKIYLYYVIRTLSYNLD